MHTARQDDPTMKRFDPHLLALYAGRWNVLTDALEVSYIFLFCFAGMLCFNQQAVLLRYVTVIFQ